MAEKFNCCLKLVKLLTFLHWRYFFKGYCKIFYHIVVKSLFLDAKTY